MQRLAVTASITIITVPAEDDESFEYMDLDQRRNSSAGWETFPLRSGRMLDSFFMIAMSSDLGVLRCSDDKDDDGVKLVTCLIDRETLIEVLPDLEALVETNAAATAHALQAHGGGQTTVDRVFHALSSRTWPESGDAAEEAAAFARQLLDHAHIAKQFRLGVCWEYRGDVTV
jgi:hypothetical protein